VLRPAVACHPALEVKRGEQQNEVRRQADGGLGIALLIVLALSMTVTASIDWQSREGTVKWTEGLTDGTHVYLDAVEISRIRAQQSPAYIVIAECFSWKDKLVAFIQPSLELRVGQTVDVEG
jgi:hypothetical protein